jgi:hypothetical protein
VVEGTLHLKGKKAAKSINVEIEPVLSENGEPRLLLRGAFRITLSDFDIEGADGPYPARDILLFDLNLVFEPAGASG